MRGKRLVAAVVPIALAGLLVPLHAVADSPSTELGFGTTVTEVADTLVAIFVDWVRNGYAKSPAMMIGLSALVVFPLLAGLGLLLRRGLTPVPSPHHDVEDTPAPTRQAWIEVEGQENSRQRIAGTMLRIGRQDDNDLCIDHKTVHRYHAVVYRSADTGFVIMDLGGDQGNGIRVNDVLVAQAPLKPGDRLLLGQVPLLFGAADNDRL
ncbi:FHA domain-containing protein [Leptospira interrogans]